MQKNKKPQWARRISRAKIRRLYQRDAQGIQDKELVDEVGYGIYARCKSIITVQEAHLGKAKCPQCDNIIYHGGDKEELLQCDKCGWELSWKEYHKTYQHKQLVGGNAIDAFIHYVNKFPSCKTYRDKMLSIDYVIHEVHKTVQDGREYYWRPAAVNLIKGNLTNIIELLNELAYGSNSNQKIKSKKRRWDEIILPQMNKNRGI